MVVVVVHRQVQHDWSPLEGGPCGCQAGKRVEWECGVEWEAGALGARSGSTGVLVAAALTISCRVGRQAGAVGWSGWAVGIGR